MVLRTNYLRRFMVAAAVLTCLYFALVGIEETFFPDKEQHSDKFIEEYAIIDRYAFTALSSLINAEADPNDPMDQYLIGSTVLNRVEHELFPTCVIDVVFQKGQYDGISSNFTRTPETDTVAVRLLNNLGRNKEVLFFYNYHRATDSKFIRFLEKNCELITVTKNHKFYGVCEVN